MSQPAPLCRIKIRMGGAGGSAPRLRKILGFEGQKSQFLNRIHREPKHSREIVHASVYRSQPFRNRRATSASMRAAQHNQLAFVTVRKLDLCSRALRSSTSYCTQSTLILHHCRQVAVCLPPTDKRLDVHLRCVGRRRRCPWPQHRHDTGPHLWRGVQRCSAYRSPCVCRRGQTCGRRAQRAEAIFAACDLLDSDLRT